MNTRSLALASALSGLVSWICGAGFALSVTTGGGDLGEFWPTLFLAGCALGGLLMMVFLALYVYWDAESRGLRGALWALLIFFFASLPGFLVYLLMRTPKLRHCPRCRTPVRDDFAVCPNCQAPVGLSCPACGRRVESSWSACPYCQRSLAPADSA